MRRLSPLLAVLVLAPLPVAASAADPPYTIKNLQVMVTVGPSGAETSCRIDADLYTPTGVDAAHPAAAVLATNGFAGSKDDFSKLAPAYAKRGYVFLAYSGLGFGGPDQTHPDRKGSSCKIELDQPDWDGKAASQMIDVLGGSRPAVDGTRIGSVIHDSVDHAGVKHTDDPRVGMIGGSYGGQVQFAAASVDKRLDAIVPQITWNDLAYSLAPNNTAFTQGVSYDISAPGVEKYQWTSLLFAAGAAATGPGSVGSQDHTHLGQCPNFDDDACKAKAWMDATGYPDQDGIDLVRKASVSSYMAQIKIPTLLVQAENDTLFNLNEAVATYNALRAQGTPVKMLWRFDGHSGSPLKTSENDPDNPEAAYASRTYLEWLDYYLRGVGGAPKLDFSYFRDWVTFPSGKDAAPAVASAPAYPVAADQGWFLSGTGDLVPSAAAVKAGAPSFQFAAQSATSYSETSGGRAEAPNQDVRDGEGTFVAFTSPALARDTDVVGIPKVTVSLTAPAQAGAQDKDPGGRLVLFAKLYEVLADGTKVLPNRLIAPVRVPDVTKPFTITLPGIAHRFLKGSKLQFVIAASDAAYKNNNLAGQATVNVDPAAPSQLTIPVLSDAPPPAPVGKNQSPGAGQQPQVFKEGVKGSAGKLSKSARNCKKNRRVITVRIKGVKKPDRIVSKRVTLNGKRVAIRHGRARIDLRRKRAGSYRVAVLVKSKQGKVRRSARTYKVC